MNCTDSKRKVQRLIMNWGSSYAWGRRNCPLPQFQTNLVRYWLHDITDEPLWLWWRRLWESEKREKFSIWQKQPGGNMSWMYRFRDLWHLSQPSFTGRVKIISISHLNRSVEKYNIWLLIFRIFKNFMTLCCGTDYCDFLCNYVNRMQQQGIQPSSYLH